MAVYYAYLDGYFFKVPNCAWQRRHQVYVPEHKLCKCNCTARTSEEQIQESSLLAYKGGIQQMTANTLEGNFTLYSSNWFIFTVNYPEELSTVWVMRHLTRYATITDHSPISVEPELMVTYGYKKCTCHTLDVHYNCIKVVVNSSTSGEHGWI